MSDQDDTEEQRELLALREALHWRNAREDLIYFAETIEIPMVPQSAASDDLYAVKVQLAAHHRLMLKAAQDLLTGKLQVDGVMAFFPPGAAKSTMLSVVTAAWAVGHFQRPYEFIATSYNSTHAEKFSRRVRQIVESKIYQQIFGATTKEDERGIEAWSTTNGNSYRCGGLRAGITGNRASCVIIDDPVKDQEEADSETAREHNWEAYLAVLDSRLKPEGKLFLIMTRWHEDDLAGRLLGEDWKGQSGIRETIDGRKWMVLNCPVFAEHRDDPLGRKDGEMLWPEYFKIEEMKRREKLGGRIWSSLWQQRPAPNEGSILNRTWWQVWKGAPPECEYVYLAYDFALEAKQEHDYSAMTAWGIFRAPVNLPRMGERILKPGQEAYHAIMLGAWQERVQAVDLVKRVLGVKQNGKVIERGHIHIWPEVMSSGMILVEQKGSGHQFVQELKRLRLPVKAVRPMGYRSQATRQVSKVPRANAVSFLLESGAVWYIPGALTNRVLDECAAFPYGAHDDLTDTVLYALSYFRDTFAFQIPSDFPDEAEDQVNKIREYENERIRAKRQGYGQIGESVSFGTRRGYGRLG